MRDASLDARVVAEGANRLRSEPLSTDWRRDTRASCTRLRFPAPAEYPALYRRPVSGQRLISQEILLLPLIYRAKLPDSEAYLGKSPYNWLLEGLRATPFRHLSLPTLSGAIPRATPPRVIHVGSCYLELGRKIHDEESRRRILLTKLSLPRNSHPPPRAFLSGELYTSRISLSPRFPSPSVYARNLFRSAVLCGEIITQTVSQSISRRRVFYTRSITRDVPRKNEPRLSFHRYVVRSLIFLPFQSFLSVSLSTRHLTARVASPYRDRSVLRMCLPRNSFRAYLAPEDEHILS